MLKKSQGFTLAELLIALAILGVIATFTIPKVLNSTTSSQNTAIAKEAASMISGSFSAYQLNSTVVSGTTPAQLTSFMNYVSVDTATTYSTGMVACSGTVPCLKLHNGGVMEYQAAQNFAGSATTNAIYFNIDPDGAGTATAATFVQYYNGRFTTYQNRDTGTTTSAAPLTPVGTDPSYIQNWN